MLNKSNSDSNGECPQYTERERDGVADERNPIQGKEMFWKRIEEGINKIEQN